MGNVVLSICRCSLVLNSTGSGVNSVQVVLSVLSMRLLSFVHVYNCCRYGCMCFWCVFIGVCQLNSYISDVYWIMDFI